MPEEQDKPKRGGRRPVIPEERYAAARILYEAVPGMSYVRLSEQIGISVRALEERSRKEGWRKSPLLPEKDMTDAAQQVADKYTGKLEEYGDEIGADQKRSAMAEVVAEVGVDMRAQLLDRHRREWGAVRKLVYETVKSKTYGDHAKLAKISAETLKLIQEGERKAWGIKDVEDEGKGVTIVVERGE